MMETYTLPDDMLKDFSDFIPEKYFYDENCNYFVVEEDDIICGFLVWRIISPLVEILHLEIFEEYRRKKYGTALVTDFIDQTQKALIPFPIKAEFPSDGRIEGIVEFFSALPHFVVIDAGSICKVSPRQRQESEYYQNLKKHSGNVIEFLDTSPIQRKGFYRMLDESEIGIISQRDEATLVKDLSLCTVHDEIITAGIMVKEYGQDVLEIAFTICKQGYGKDLAILMGELARRIDENYPDAELCMNLIAEPAIKLAAKVFGVNRRQMPISEAYSFGLVG